MKDLCQHCQITAVPEKGNICEDCNHNLKLLKEFAIEVSLLTLSAVFDLNTRRN